MINYGQCTYDMYGYNRCTETATHHYVRPDNVQAGEIFVCDKHKAPDGKEGRRNWGWIEVIIPVMRTEPNKIVCGMSDETVYVIRRVTRIHRAEEWIKSEPTGSEFYEMGWEVLFHEIQYAQREEIRNVAKTAVRRLTA